VNALRPLVAVLVLASSGTARAQSAADTSAGVARSRWPVDAWGSAGIGVGSISGVHGSALAVVLRANASAGPLLLSYRSSDVGPWGAGDGVRDDGVLVGLRTDHRRLFASGAVGFARARTYHQCDCSDGPQSTSRVSGLAYDVTMHANAVFLGAALSFSGVAAARKANYLAITAAFELGWFGWGNTL
jgi:hypothetical protein